MTIKQPPYVNGEMTLTDDQATDIQAKLLQIQAAFAPTDEQPMCDTFYLVSTYNRENVGAEINGDTSEMLLSEEQPQSEV